MNKRERRAKKHWRRVKDFPVVRLALKLYELDTGKKVGIRDFIGACVFLDAFDRLNEHEDEPGLGRELGLEPGPDGTYAEFLDALWRLDAAAIAQAAAIYTAPRPK